MIVSAIRAACVAMMTGGRDEDQTRREQDGIGWTKLKERGDFCREGEKTRRLSEGRLPLPGSQDVKGPSRAGLNSAPGCRGKRARIV